MAYESMNKILWFIQNSLAEGKKPNKDGYYVYTNKEISEGIKITTSTIAKWMNMVVDSLNNDWSDNFKGWLPGSEEPIYMISDAHYYRGVLSFRRNPDSLNPELDYYWAPHPLNNYFVYVAYDSKHRRRHHGDKARYGCFPWNWSEEQVEKAYQDWLKILSKNT